ncbi:H+/gluconate symporter and related permeases [Raoultella planticola]|uniref:H+/gluconate symporter and related permeases n=1 Tax=Raoultella planticola TaxID=575 RepID=A0A485B7Z4_RAOPL|nr:H+/gluconate symporter and related permeases [Raoultella planticola]
MLAAYRGYSVILFAPLAALGAVLLTQPAAVAPVFSDIFMDKLVGFVKLYFPVFLLGAVFGKLIEFSGFSRSIVSAVTRLMGQNKAMPVIILVCALLTYGGVSLFVVVFAVYPFAAEMFRQSQIPKRLMPATIALGGLYLHHGCPAGFAADPEHHPDHLLWHHLLGRAVAGDSRIGLRGDRRLALSRSNAA